MPLIPHPLVWHLFGDLGLVLATVLLFALVPVLFALHAYGDAPTSTYRPKSRAARLAANRRRYGR